MTELITSKEDAIKLIQSLSNEIAALRDVEDDNEFVLKSAIVSYKLFKTGFEQGILVGKQGRTTRRLQGRVRMCQAIDKGEDGGPGMTTTQERGGEEEIGGFYYYTLEFRDKRKYDGWKGKIVINKKDDDAKWILGHTSPDKFTTSKEMAMKVFEHSMNNNYGGRENVRNEKMWFIPAKRVPVEEELM